MLLVDEPTGHQDAGWAAAVLDELRRTVASGTGCLAATHDPLPAGSPTANSRWRTGSWRRPTDPGRHTDLTVFVTDARLPRVSRPVIVSV